MDILGFNFEEVVEVWMELQQSGVGKVDSSKELAKNLGSLIVLTKNSGSLTILTKSTYIYGIEQWMLVERP